MLNLVVDNQSWTDWTVEFATRSITWQRVGRVGALTVRRYNLPEFVRISGVLRLRIVSRLEGKMYQIPQAVYLNGNERFIRLVIPNNFPLADVTQVE